MAPRLGKSFRTNTRLVEHVHKLAPEVLFEYGIVFPTDLYLFARFKANLHAHLMYESMVVENYRSSLKDPFNLGDRHRLIMRHLERVNSKIAYSETGSVQLAEAFAERAMMSYEVGEDWWCLFNLDMISYMKVLPVELWCEVRQLYAEAYERARGIFYPPLEYSGLLPSCHTAAVLSENNVYGRHMRAERWLSQGEQVNREVPFVRLLIADNLLRCEYCLAYNPFVLNPCGSCSRVLYCTPKCNMHATAEYHALECSNLGFLRTHYTSLEQLAARLTVRAVVLFCGNLDLIEAAGQWSTDRVGSDCYNYPQGFNSNQRTVYEKIYKLSTNRKRLTKTELISDAAKALGLAKLLAPEVERIYGTKNDLRLQNGLAVLLVHHLQISRCNTLYLSRSPDNPEEVTTTRKNSKPFAAVLMTSGSMFNHSCEPNVEYSLDRFGTVQFTANTNIPRKAELLINYGVSNTWPRYRFKCTCAKCVPVGEPE